MTTTSTPKTTHDDDAVGTGLQLRDITLDVGDGAAKVRAMDSVNLEVAAGELLAVVGPSGAGKSSLLAVAGALAVVPGLALCAQDLVPAELHVVRGHRVLLGVTAPPGSSASRSVSTGRGLKYPEHLSGSGDRVQAPGGHLVPPAPRRGRSSSVRLSVFSSKPYDRHFLGSLNDEEGFGHELVFFDARLEEPTVPLASISLASA